MPVVLGTTVGVGVSVGGIGVSVGKDVFVGKGVDVGGAGVETGAHPLNITVSTTNAKNTDGIDFFNFDLLLIGTTAPNGCFSRLSTPLNKQ